MGILRPEGSLCLKVAVEWGGGLEVVERVDGGCEGGEEVLLLDKVGRLGMTGYCPSCGRLGAPLGPFFASNKFGEQEDEGEGETFKEASRWLCFGAATVAGQH